MRATTMAMLLLLGACASQSGSGSGRLRAGEWAAVNLNGVPVDGGPLTLRLEDGQAGGHGGCNSWSSAYRLMAREGIRFDAIASTEIGCAPEVMEQEARYFSILRHASGYSLYGDGSLSIIAADGRAIRFRRR